MPGNEPKYFINAGLHAPDAIILDLEDSVHPAEKDAARILVRNALRARHPKVDVPSSGLKMEIARILKEEGYIRGFSQTDFGNGRTEFEIELKYHEGQPVIRQIERVSKPGRRVYSAVTNMPRVANGLGITIVSTPKGVMADHAARENNVGGEVLCKVF